MKYRSNNVLLLLEDKTDDYQDRVALGIKTALGWKEFTYKGEYEWWKNKSKGKIAMHPDTKRFVDIMLKTMANEENNDCLRPIRAKHFYKISSVAVAEV